MNLQNQTLFFGDNLQIVEEKLPDNFFDLIYLDPPFNSNRNYNVLFKEGLVDSSAQIRAFEDTWEWTPPTIKLYENLRDKSNPQIRVLINSLYEIIGPNPMMAYLVNISARLIPLKRVLKNNGSIYLHCDPTASHYIKIIMDAIFGKEFFKNEIIWSNESSSGFKSQVKSKFIRGHDVILFYSYDNAIFNIQTFPLALSTIRRYDKVDEKGQRYKSYYEVDGSERKQYLSQSQGRKLSDTWTDLPSFQTVNASREWLGYPTQKPEVLLERIIKSSSNKGCWVLDPFCGCGTTVAVAERLERNWIGIDISMQAINTIKERMKAHFSYINVNLDGIPMDFEAAKTLSEKDKYAFQDWAITLVGANPPSGVSKKGADRGIDGIILFRDKSDFSKPRLRKILVQVKGGGVNRGDVAKLKGDIERDDAPMGILISLKEATSEMKREAALSGEYKYSDATSFPRIQLLSIHEWFEGKELKIPTDKINPFKKAEEKSMQLSLLD
jgi:site-specific DNA-methyltransferase (adenine-specific)